MATVTGLTAERMQAIEAASVVDGDVVGNDLILTKHDGSTINAGNVRGPTGPVGPAGSNLPVVSALPVLEPGLANQIRAGRTLLPIDFTNMGLSAPIGLWNLSDLTDVSGNGRNLLNKGAVPFGVGINGVAASAAVFSGAVGQGLYVADTGVSDPFRVKNISWGFWFRSGKRDTQQDMVGKWGLTAGQGSFLTEIDPYNELFSLISLTGSDSLGVTAYNPKIGDDRWHFVVTTYDGYALKIYVDGNLENMTYAPGSIFPGNGSFTIGGRDANAAQNVVLPTYGRIDEVFVTSDVLNDEQIRNLYCAKIPHTLGAVPFVVNLGVRRQRRGAAFVSSDFPSQPLHLYNFTAGAVTDQGSLGNTLIIDQGSGSIKAVAGVDGSKDNALGFVGNVLGLVANDTGLPSGLSSRSFGCWFKTGATPGAGQVAMSWGSSGAEERLWTNGAGMLTTTSGSDTVENGKFVSDGTWHFVVIVEDNSAGDGVKRRVYLDGKLVIGSTVMGSVNLGGTNRFRIGAWIDGTLCWTGQLDSAFIHSGVLTPEQVVSLYMKSSQALPRSPKDSGAHVEAMDAGSLYATFDELDSNALIDLAVAS
ncbi:MAG: LamG-like jellyroll fold domain-containing protein [Paenisporosarcina sp.]